MKKVILSLIIGLSLNLTSIAQVNKHNIGVFMGGGLSSTTSSILSYGMGYNIGLSYTYKFHKNFAIVTGLDYDRRSSYMDDATINYSPEDIRDYKFQHNLNFIRVPLMLNINIGKKVKYFVNTGVSLGYLISQKQTTEIDGELTVYNDLDLFNRFEIDLNIGIGVQFPLSEKTDFTVEARFKKGLNDLVKTRYFKGNNDFHTSSNALLLIGVKYKLPKKKRFKMNL